MSTGMRSIATAIATRIATIGLTRGSMPACTATATPAVGTVRRHETGRASAAILHALEKARSVAHPAAIV
jgi:hypothetical protein